MMWEQFPEVRYIDYIVTFSIFLSFRVKSYHMWLVGRGLCNIHDMTDWVSGKFESCLIKMKNPS